MKYGQIVENLKGIFPPVVTTFDSRGDVDERRFRENLERYVGIGLGGVVVAGSTGEAPYLSERERLRLLDMARDVVRPPELLIVGTGLESTRDTLRLSREAVARGADALLVVTPNYYKKSMDSSALVAHYRAVADGVERPVVIYSIPQFTGIQIATEAVAKLSRHPNIPCLKESSGDLAFVRRVLSAARPGFRVLVGAAQILVEALCAEAAGAILAQACFAPELCVAAYLAYCQGQMKTARDLARRLAPLAERVNVPYGVAGIKAALDESGYFGGDPRPPLSRLKPQARKVVAVAIRQARAGLEF